MTNKYMKHNTGRKNRIFSLIILIAPPLVCLWPLLYERRNGKTLHLLVHTLV